jgi:hypothetical protein
MPVHSISSAATPNRPFDIRLSPFGICGILVVRLTRIGRQYDHRTVCVPA